MLYSICHRDKCYLSPDSTTCPLWEAPTCRQVHGDNTPWTMNTRSALYGDVIIWIGFLHYAPFLDVRPHPPTPPHNHKWSVVSLAFNLRQRNSCNDLPGWSISQVACPEWTYSQVLRAYWPLTRYAKLRLAYRIALISGSHTLKVSGFIIQIFRT